MEFFHKPTSFPFMATRRVWYGLSIILMIVSITSLATRGLNLAIDFTGGITVEATFPKTADIDAVRSHLAAAGFHDATVQNYGSSRDIAIRLPPAGNQQGTQESQSSAIRAKIEPVLKSVDPGALVQSIEVIGPQVGGELARSAAWALAFTLGGIFIYIAFRFHTWRLSLGAI
ncbi:MAG: protein translocase subunit SecF, partial [Steroidobacteraceae bacterium]